MLLCREHHSSPVFTTKSKPFFAVAPFPGSWSLVARWSPFFLGKMASSISPGGKQGRSSSNGRPSLLISYLSEQPSTICTVLVSLSLLSIAVIAIILVIILSSKIILCFQIPFHRGRHFLPTSDSATTPCLFISVLFSSSCTRSVLKVKTQYQAIKFRVQSE